MTKTSLGELKVLIVLLSLLLEEVET